MSRMSFVSCNLRNDSAKIPLNHCQRAACKIAQSVREVGVIALDQSVKRK